MTSQQKDIGIDQSPQVIRNASDLRDKCLRTDDSVDAAQQAIDNAELALDQLSVNFDAWIETESKHLAAARDAAKAAGFSDNTLRDLFQSAHNLKGQATTLGYPLADEICASLCRLIDKVPETSRLPTDLIDQHVDAVRALVNEGAKGTGNPKASVLAKRLRDVTSEFLAREAARKQAA